MNSCIVEWEDGSKNSVKIWDIAPSLRSSVTIDLPIRQVGKGYPKGVIMGSMPIQQGDVFIKLDTISDVISARQESLYPIETHIWAEAGVNVAWRYDLSWTGRITGTDENLCQYEEHNDILSTPTLRTQTFTGRNGTDPDPITTYSDSGSECSTDSESEVGSDLSDEFDSEDELPLRDLRPSSNVSKDSYRWRNRENPFSGRTFDFLGYRQPATVVRDPHAYFDDYFPAPVLERIAQYSNQKAGMQGKLLNLTSSELKRWIAVSKWMSLIRLGATKRYWNAKTRVPQVADVFTRNRYLEIKSNLYFCDINERSASTSKTRKFDLLLESFNATCSKIPMDSHLSVDEQIVPYKGRKTALRQYNPKKPKKWGYKIFILSGENGLCHKLEFYQGKTESQSTNEPLPVGKSGDVVLRLADAIPKNENYRLFFDNWFNSANLQLRLYALGILTVGTLNLNRAPNLQFSEPRDFARRGRGSVESKQAEINYNGHSILLNATRWYDLKMVHLLSTYVGQDPIQTCQRYNKTDKKYDTVNCPNIVKEYNKFMGFVDEGNRYIALFRTNIHCNKRHYLRIFYHLIDFACVNAWVLYRRDSSDTGGRKKETLDLFEFCASVCSAWTKEVAKPRVSAGYNSLDLEHDFKKRRGGPQTNIVPPHIRRDRVDHWPGSSKQRKICAVPTCGSKINTKCKKCDAHLCINQGDCYSVFHD